MKPNRFENVDFFMKQTPDEKNNEIAGHLIDFIQNKKGTWARSGDVLNVTAGGKKAAILINPTNEEKAEKEAIRLNKNGIKFYNAVSLADLEKWLKTNL